MKREIDSQISHSGINPKVISLKAWRDQKDQERESDSLKRYMNVLSFSDLIHESQGVIHEIKTSKVDQDLTERAGGLINEFHNRLSEEDTSDWSKALGEMKKRLEKTLTDLGKLF